MYEIVKKVAFGILGKETVKKIKSIFIKEKKLFSEADLILMYFTKNPRKGIMIDAGVHYGESCMPYNDLDWDIYGFEPDPNNRKLIPDIKNLKLYHNAVSDQDGIVLNFYGSDESSGISSLSAFRDSHVVIGQVETKTLNTLVDEERIEKVDLLKIDIEGHDLFALKGFPFEKLKPEIIICEFEDFKTIPLNYDYTDLGNFLIAKGYVVYISEWEPIIRYGIQHNWHNIRKFPSKLDNKNGWGNFIAIRPEEDAKFQKTLNTYLKAY